MRPRHFTSSHHIFLIPHILDNPTCYVDSTCSSCYGNPALSPVRVGTFFLMHNPILSADEPVWIWLCFIYISWLEHSHSDIISLTLFADYMICPIHWSIWLSCCSISWSSHQLEQTMENPFTGWLVLTLVTIGQAIYHQSWVKESDNNRLLNETYRNLSIYSSIHLFIHLLPIYYLSSSRKRSLRFLLYNVETTIYTMMQLLHKLIKYSTTLILKCVTFFNVRKARDQDCSFFFFNNLKITQAKNTYFVFLSSVVKSQSMVNITKTSSSSMRELNCVYLWENTGSFKNNITPERWVSQSYFHDKAMRKLSRLAFFIK